MRPVIVKQTLVEIAFYFSGCSSPFTSRGIVEIEDSLDLSVRSPRTIPPPNVVVDAFTTFDISWPKTTEAASESVFESIANGTFPTAVPTCNYGESCAEWNSSWLFESPKCRQLNAF